MRLKSGAGMGIKMFDISTEQIIKTKPPVRALVYKILLVILCVISAVSVLFIWTIGMLVCAAFVALTVFVFHYYNAEYEYSLIDDELTINRISNKSRMRFCGKFNISKAELVTNLNSQDDLRKQKAILKVLEYTANDDEYTDNIIVIYLDNGKEGQTRLIIQPDERMLNALKKVVKGNIFKVEVDKKTKNI